ncbi:hypothetical protein [Flavobacterium sp. MMS24-S5]|uniref:hypothetical protein n=1 Tax=Flavobacterium sp. MMS24-S5 TaxID=3416605 RepID=UPI003CFC8196
MNEKFFLGKNYKNILSVVIFIIISFLFVFSYFQKTVEEVNYEDELSYKYNGFVVNKYVDSADHSICKLVLKSGKIINVWDNCYQKVEIGDSVVKNKGSFDFLIYNSYGTETVNIQDNLIIPK